MKKKTYLPATLPSSSKKIMILIMVSEKASEETIDIQDLVSQRLSDLKNWKLEHFTIFYQDKPSILV